MVFVYSSNVLIPVDASENDEGGVYVVLIICFVTKAEADHWLTDLTLVIQGKEEWWTLTSDISWWNTEHSLILKPKLLSYCQEVKILNTCISIFIFLYIN